MKRGAGNGIRGVDQIVRSVNVENCHHNDLFHPPSSVTSSYRPRLCLLPRYRQEKMQSAFWNRFVDLVDPITVESFSSVTSISWLMNKSTWLGITAYFSSRSRWTTLKRNNWDNFIYHLRVHCTFRRQKILYEGTLFIRCKNRLYSLFDALSGLSLVVSTQRTSNQVYKTTEGLSLDTETL